MEYSFFSETFVSPVRRIICACVPGRRPRVGVRNAAAAQNDAAFRSGAKRRSTLDMPFAPCAAVSVVYANAGRCHVHFIGAERRCQQAIGAGKGEGPPQWPTMISAMAAPIRRRFPYVLLPRASRKRDALGNI
jgi:hypothetical protein